MGRKEIAMPEPEYVTKGQYVSDLDAFERLFRKDIERAVNTLKEHTTTQFTAVYRRIDEAETTLSTRIDALESKMDTLFSALFAHLGISLPK
jgi:hypothetical protein